MQDSFWSKVKKLNHPSSSSRPSVIDGVSGDSNIANAFASNLRTLLNTHSTSQRDSLYTSLVSSVSSLDLKDIVVIDEDVIQAIHCLKSGKSDDANMFSEHASPVIAGSLASFFTACLRHGYMPSQIHDCI